MSTTTAFDLDRFTRAAEERDAMTQLSMYGPQATVTIVDTITQPGAPRVLRNPRGHRGVVAGHVRARHDPCGPAHRQG